MDRDRAGEAFHTSLVKKLVGTAGSKLVTGSFSLADTAMLGRKICTPQASASTVHYA